MKRKIIALSAVCSLALSALALAQPPPGDPAEDGPGGHGRHGFHGKGGHEWLGHLTEKLNLTADQKAKVQPIVDATKPQMVAIHQEAMQKAKSVMENAMSQIRPMLTPEQVTKLDAMKAAHEKMRDARKEMHDAASQ